MTSCGNWNWGSPAPPSLWMNMALCIYGLDLFVAGTFRLGIREDSHVAWCEFLLLQDVGEDGIGACPTGTVTAGCSVDIYTSKRHVGGTMSKTHRWVSRTSLRLTSVLWYTVRYNSDKSAMSELYGYLKQMHTHVLSVAMIQRQKTQSVPRPIDMLPDRVLPNLQLHDMSTLWHFTQPSEICMHRPLICMTTMSHTHTPARFSRGRAGLMRLMYVPVYPSSTQLLWL